MKNALFLLTFVCCAFGLIAFRERHNPELAFATPDGWPEPVYNFAKNPLSEAGFQLGRKLFYDPMLSRDSKVSCASCHSSFTGFTHVDHAVSHGIAGRTGTRNTPVLINLAWNRTFHWDGGVNHLEAQGINPLTHPKEMDNTLEEVIRRLSASPAYTEQFKAVFGDTKITTARIMKALTQFTVSLVSANAKYDRVLRKEPGMTFTEQETNGLAIFRNNCATCHAEPLFTTTTYASNGLPVNPLYGDAGRYAITHDPKDSLQFKVPTLRNCEFTYPYMHDGRYRRLKDVINYYSDSLDGSAPALQGRITGPMHFSEAQKKDLLAFLLTLTDKEFLFDPRYQYPR